MTPFDPQPLTPAQEKEIADRALATTKLVQLDADINDINVQLSHLYQSWIDHSNLPNQSPLDPNVPTREMFAAEYWNTKTLRDKLVIYRGTVMGWKRNAGQPNHPPEMPVFVE